MGRKKVDVSQESFLSTPAEIAADVASDPFACAKTENCTHFLKELGKCSSECEHSEAVTGIPVAEGVDVPDPEQEADWPTVCINVDCPAYNAEEANGCLEVEHVYECSTCIGKEEAPVLAEEGEVTTPFTSDGNHGPYVTRDPDKISAPFTRELPVPVPDEELADHAKNMARLQHLWVKTKLDAKKFAKACKDVVTKTEEELLELAEIIDAGTEERPVKCQWEFDYAAGTKKLRRLDTWQIVSEETLQGDELHLSFDFQRGNEENVAKFFEGREGQPVDAEFDDSNPPHEGEGTFIEPLTEDQIDSINSELAEASEEMVDVAEPVEVLEPKADLTLPSGYPCKICGFDAGSHIYLVRHLRDNHAMKLSEYRAQYP